MREGRTADRLLRQCFAVAAGSGGFSKTLRLLKHEGLKGFIQKWASLRIEHMQYNDWIRCYDAITDEVRAGIRRRVEGLARRPLLSVLMPSITRIPNGSLKPSNPSEGNYIPIGNFVLQTMRRPILAYAPL